MTKLIILDRDGVINYDSEDYIKSPAEWHPIPGSLRAIAQLKQAGYTVTVASNQSGVARQYYDIAMLQTIHDKMQHACQSHGGSIDKIYYCPHHPDEACACRKPKPGLLQQIANDFSCDLTQVPMVGDRLTDVLAAQAVNARPLVVETGMRPFTAAESQSLHGIERYADLLQAVKVLLK